VAALGAQGLGLEGIHHILSTRGRGQLHKGKEQLHKMKGQLQKGNGQLRMGKGHSHKGSGTVAQGEGSRLVALHYHILSLAAERFCDGAGNGRGREGQGGSGRGREGQGGAGRMLTMIMLSICVSFVVITSDSTQNVWPTWSCHKPTQRDIFTILS